jgi:hypothetical protein
MKVLRFNEWLNESLKINEDTGVHSYGCAMLYFDFPDMESLHSKIEKDDIYTDGDSDRGFGLEKDSHVTLLYGLHSEEIEDNQVIDICTSENLSDLILYNASIFENDQYDVLKFDIRYDIKGGAFLHKINKKLGQLPHTTSFPDYHPHSTVSYLKSGSGKKYMEMFKDLEYTVKPKELVYSKPDGSKITKLLK